MFELLLHFQDKQLYTVFHLLLHIICTQSNHPISAMLDRGSAEETQTTKATQSATQKRHLLHKVPHEEVRSSNVYIPTYYAATRFTQRKRFTSTQSFLILCIFYKSKPKKSYFYLQVFSHHTPFADPRPKNLNTIFSYQYVVRTYSVLYIQIPRLKASPK